MNKFKKVMLGALSVLTLGLFVVVGTKVNATTVDEGYTAISTASLKTTQSHLSVYGSSTNSRPQDVTNYYVAFDGNWNWYNEAINASVYENVTNNTGCTFDSLVIATGNSKTFSMKVPAGKTKINCIIYLLCMAKADSTNKYSLKTSGTTTITIPNTVTNLKHDDTSVNSLASISADSAIHKVSFSYESATQITVNSGMAVLGFGVKDDSATYAISYNANGHGTAPTYSGANVSALNNSILGAIISGVSGFRFTGWYLDEDCTIAATTSSVLSTYADNGAVTLYAGWEEITEYDIEFYVGDTLYDTKTVALSGDRKLTSWPTDPTKANATFDGWYDGDNKVGADTVFTGDTTLVAKFNLDTIAIGTTKTLSFDDSSLTVDDNKFYDSITYNKFSIDNTDLVIKKDSAFRFNDNGSIDKNYISFNIPANSIAKIVFEKYRCTSKDKTVTLTISDGTTSKTVSTTGQTNLCRYTTFENTAESPKTIYIYKSGSNTLKLGVLKVSVSEYSTTKISSNAELEFVAQYNGTAENHSDATKLRLVGTIYGIELADYQNIKSATFTFTFNDANRTGECTQLYSSVASLTELFSGGDNIMYVVFNLNNINKSGYSGKVISNLKFTVEFNDADNTKLEITHNNITLPTFA